MSQEVMAVMKLNNSMTKIIECNEEDRPRFELVFPIFNENAEVLEQWVAKVVATGKLRKSDIVIKLYDGKFVKYQIW
jgi:hypothetical protein